MGLGLYSTQDGHWVPLIYPVDITGGKTTAYFNMAKYAHASILIMIGVSAAAEGAITLNAASDSAGTGATAIPFTVFKAEVALTDVLGAKVAVTAAGFTPPATDTIFYVIEIDAQSLPQGLNWLALVAANTTNSVIAAAAAYLSGARQACDQSPTVLS
jgi:hypothetical protein